MIELIRRALKGEAVAPVAEAFEITRSVPHGDVGAVRHAMQRLGLASLLSPRPCWKASVVQGMVAARIVAPHTKLATTRWWHTRTLPEDLGIERANEDALYEAMDWLLARQATIEKKLAARHLRPGSRAQDDQPRTVCAGYWTEAPPVTTVGSGRNIVPALNSRD